VERRTTAPDFGARSGPNVVLGRPDARVCHVLEHVQVTVEPLDDLFSGREPRVFVHAQKVIAEIFNPGECVGPVVHVIHDVVDELVNVVGGIDLHGAVLDRVERRNDGPGLRDPLAA